VVSPVIILALSSVHDDGLDLYLAIMATTFGNLLPALFWIRGYGLPVWQNPGLNGYAVGTVNLGLWVIASADRVILERLAIPVVVATYALTYGLLDKGFRSLANIMVTRFLGDAFSTGNLRIPRKFYGVTSAGAVVSVPLAVILSDLVSAGAYVLDWRITTILTMALLFMVWSTPGYLLLLRRGRFRTSVCVVLLLATINIVMNLLLAQQLGALGAAGSSLVSYLTWFIWTKLASRRHTV
jgi:O-antigen/teichoic acid export membrane protein